MEGRILVVDDSEVNLLVSRSKLEEAGLSVDTASDGQIALDLLSLDGPAEEDVYDAVLLDIMMPEIDGYEVLRRIREKRSAIRLPVIITTAKDRTEDVLRALELGANDFVTKPLNLAILVARLETHLRLKRAHQELREAQQALVNAARIESVGFLAAGVAHEIRNPLGRIQMSVGGLRGLLAQLPESSQKSATLIADTLEQSVDAADKIVRGLMQAANEQQLRLEPVDLNGWIRRLSKSFQRQSLEAGVRFTFRKGPLSRPTLLATAEFQQVLESLVENSLQALAEIPEPDRRLSIETSEATLERDIIPTGGRSGNRLRKGDLVSVITLLDNGPGISSRHLESVFDPFFSTRPSGSGSGLGLTIVRKIVELHHGEITLENRPSPDSGVAATLYLKTQGGLTTHV